MSEYSYTSGLEYQSDKAMEKLIKGCSKWNEKEVCTLSNQKAEPLTINTIRSAWKVIEDFRKREMTYNKVRSEILHILNKNKGERKMTDVCKYLMDKAGRMTVSEFKEFYVSFKEKNPKLFKGERKMLKIILKGTDTGTVFVYRVPESDEKKPHITNLKVGQVVYFKEMGSATCEICRIIRIALPKVSVPKGAVFSEFASLPFGWNPFWGGRRAGRATFTREYLDNLKQENKEREEYNKKPYFLVRLDPIKGKPDGKENLEKMKFPCWVLWKSCEIDKDRIGMLVTGYPQTLPVGETEYQLIDMMKQVETGSCCTIARSTNLKSLMERWSIEVIKGETQTWKVGSVNV